MGGGVEGEEPLRGHDYMREGLLCRKVFFNRIWTLRSMPRLGSVPRIPSTGNTALCTQQIDNNGKSYPFPA